MSNNSNLPKIPLNIKTNEDLAPDAIIPPSDPRNNLIYQGEDFIIKKYFGNYNPVGISMNDFNPFYNPKISIPSLFLTIIFDSYYRRRYVLVNNETIRLFAMGVNYFTFYYLIANGIKFYEYKTNIIE